MRIRWRGLELPTRVVRDEGASTPTYGKFVVEPFERGFGTTVGNSLRRILLSSLEGAAVTHVRLKGADHEFKTLPGVVEDVTEIILNVKSLIVESTADEPKTMRINVKGQKGATVEVRADRIEADAALEIVNADQLLATLTDDVEFDLEMTVGRGRGYATADDHKAAQGNEQIIGVIPVDSVYSPVTRVRYRVEDTRVGQRTNYDRLVLEIWTNGTVSPEMALVEAAKILRKHINPFVQYFELTSSLAVEAKADEPVEPVGETVTTVENKLAMPVGSLDLSVRASNCLASAGIATVGDLIKWDEPGLLKLRSFGKTSLREVKRKLADIGLALRTEPDFPGEKDPFGSAMSGSSFSGSPMSSYGSLPDFSARSSGTSQPPVGGVRLSGQDLTGQVGVLPLSRIPTPLHTAPSEGEPGPRPPIEGTARPNDAGSPGDEAPKPVPGEGT